MKKITRARRRETERANLTNSFLFSCCRVEFLWHGNSYIAYSTFCSCTEVDGANCVAPARSLLSFGRPAHHRCLAPERVYVFYNHPYYVYHSCA